jgi:hypothetical protein
LVNIHIDKQKVLEKLEEWMDWLETPNDDFGGFPVCPFLAPERKTNKLLIEFYNPEEGSIFESIKKFDEDDNFTTAMYLHTDYHGNYTVVNYQNFINESLEKINLGHLKAVCFNPYDKRKTNGVLTRKGAPCFITSIATREALGSAYRKLEPTTYWKKNRENA